MKYVSLTEEELHLIKKILNVPYDAIFFGSRVDGTNHKFSDVDLCLKGHRRIEGYDMQKIREAFEESDLPYTIDLVDYDTLSSSFKKSVDEKGIPLNKCNPVDH